MLTSAARPIRVLHVTLAFHPPVELGRPIEIVKDRV